LASSAEESILQLIHHRRVQPLEKALKGNQFLKGYLRTLVRIEVV
jgi:hypothetical protein